MKVTIVIPNYNGKHFMTPCLQSLENQSFNDFTIIVVDNASTDGSLEYMQENYPSIRTIALDKNYGFSKAANVGIMEADTPFVILLNNDTVVDKNYVGEMVRAIEASDKIFSVSSKMIQMYHPEAIDNTGDLYTILGWAISRGNGQPVANYTNASSVFSACAGAAIYRRSVFEEIGYFDLDHFAYLEDVDVGYRAKIFGYKNIYCPTALVSHVGSGTSGSKYNSFKVKLAARNNLYLAYKNLPLLQLIINILPLILGGLVKYCFFIKKGFAKDYREGFFEGIRTLSKCKKVPFKTKNLPNYILIEFELVIHTFTYVKDWFSFKFLKK